MARSSKRQPARLPKRTRWDRVRDGFGFQRLTIAAALMTIAGASFIALVGLGAEITSVQSLTLLTLAIVCVLGIVATFELIGLRLAGVLSLLVIAALSLVGFLFPPNQLAPTKQTLFEPGRVPGEPNIGGPPFYITLYVLGTCAGHSIRNPGRAYAYRCRPTADGKEYDPCFRIRARIGTSEMDCYNTPWAKATTNGVTKAAAYGFQTIAQRNDKDASMGDAAWERPWALDLDNGTYCILLGEGLALPAGPPDQLYQCLRRGLEQVVGYIVQEFPDRIPERWTILFQPVGGTIRRVTVAEAIK